MKETFPNCSAKFFSSIDSHLWIALFRSTEILTLWSRCFLAQSAEEWTINPRISLALSVTNQPIDYEGDNVNTRWLSFNYVRPISCVTYSSSVWKTGLDGGWWKQAFERKMETLEFLLRNWDDGSITSTGPRRSKANMDQQTGMDAHLRSQCRSTVNAMLKKVFVLSSLCWMLRSFVYDSVVAVVVAGFSSHASFNTLRWIGYPPWKHSHRSYVRVSRPTSIFLVRLIPTKDHQLISWSSRPQLYKGYIRHRIIWVHPFVWSRILILRQLVLTSRKRLIHTSFTAYSSLRGDAEINVRTQVVSLLLLLIW